jgi:hypothetical protein
VLLVSLRMSRSRERSERRDQQNCDYSIAHLVRKFSEAVRLIQSKP